MYDLLSRISPEKDQPRLIYVLLLFVSFFASVPVNEYLSPKRGSTLSFLSSSFSSVFSVLVSFWILVFKSRREPEREKEREGDTISEIRNSSFEEL